MAGVTARLFSFRIVSDFRAGRGVTSDRNRSFAQWLIARSRAKALLAESEALMCKESQSMAEAKVTTLVIGEENPPITTLVLGEENPPVTTMAVGEEDPAPLLDSSVTTMALGEEDPPVTTLPLSEEDTVLTTLAVGEEDPPVTTKMVGEEEPERQ